MIPYQTLNRINELLEKDQGNAYRALLREFMPQAEDAYRQDDNPFRSHLGASLMGRECDRYLWQSFHWVHQPAWPGRMIRLFNRGHLEEARFLALLRLIGCEVWHHDAAGKQIKVTGHGGHYGGSLDCVVRGVLEFPELAVLAEFKTHSDKSFTTLAGKPDEWRRHVANPQKEPFMGEGVRAAKFEHFVQMQLYMGFHSLPYALYLATNKNDDALYAEVVPWVPEVYDRFYQRAGDIIDAATPPKRIKDDPSWYACKFCDLHPYCHKRVPPAKNCRTCTHSHPMTDGTWRCYVDTNALSGETHELSKEAQLEGCGRWAVIQGL